MSFLFNVLDYAYKNISCICRFIYILDRFEWNLKFITEDYSVLKEALYILVTKLVVIWSFTLKVNSWSLIFNVFYLFSILRFYMFRIVSSLILGFEFESHKSSIFICSIYFLSFLKPLKSCAKQSSNRKTD